MALKSHGICVALAFVLLAGSMASAGAVGVGGKCGTFLNGFCDPGLFCDHRPGTCNLLGGTGTCVRIPTVCPLVGAKARPRIVLPVCGCNNMTYANDCERIKAMEQKAHNGRCQ
jgi:hypothetical protein